MANLWVGAAWGAWLIGLAWWLLRLLSDLVSPCADYYGDDSSSGVRTWQAWPPGVTCTYSDASGSPVVQIAPGYGTVAFLLLLVALPVYAAASRRPKRRGVGV
jgi:hypothetical protein